MQKPRFQKWLPALFCGVVCYILFSEPALCARGVREALAICGNTVLPSLFPFMVVSGFLVHSGLSAALGRAVSPVTARLFRLPGVSAGVILMSLVGGFPVGVKMTAQLLNSGELNESQAKRMCLFCVNAGPAFVISAVGTTVLGSTRAGVLLYASLCIAALLLGICTRFFAKKEPCVPKKERMLLVTNPAVALSDAVRESVYAMLQICAWIVLFGALGTYLQSLPLPDTVTVLINCITEVTAGVSAAAGWFSLPMLAAVLAFSGLSVHCQLLRDLKHCGVRYSVFFLVRCAAAALSFAICTLLLRFFPCEISVFSASDTVVPAAYSVSAPSFLMLMLMSILLILEVEPRRKVC